MVVSAFRRLIMLLIRVIVLGIYLLRFSVGFYRYDIFGYLQYDDPEMLKLKFDQDFMVGFFYFQFAFSVLFLMVIVVNKKDWYSCFMFFTWIAFLGSVFIAVLTIVVKKLYNAGLSDFKNLNAKSIELIFAVAVAFASLAELVSCWKATSSITTNGQHGANRIDAYIEPESDNETTSRIENRERGTSYVSHDSREVHSTAPPIMENIHDQQQQPSLSPQWLEMQESQVVSASQLEALYGPPPAYKP